MMRSQLPSGWRRATWIRPPVSSDGRVEARALIRLAHERLALIDPLRSS